MRRVGMAIVMVALACAAERAGSAQGETVLRIAAHDPTALRSWDAYVTQRERSGDLRARTTVVDPQFPARRIERLQQFHDGVPIWGAEVVRDSEAGLTHAIFGAVAPDVTLSVTPLVSASRVAAAASARGAVWIEAPSLCLVRLDSGEYRLAYTGVLAAADVARVFVDARTGGEIRRISQEQTQSAVGSGRGVLGDLKKLSVAQQAGVYVADDRLRPPRLITYDMRGDFNRLLSVRVGQAPLLASDVAVDTDNDWTDQAAVDAHAHIGWTYDYYVKRHGRRGLDDHDRILVTLINGLTPQAGAQLPVDLASLYAYNAAWCGPCGPGGVGIMRFGNGLPAGVATPTGQSALPLAGALDIAAHELTHGVLESSSGLIYANESGALNEAFADMMGTSVEFFYQTPGTGLGQADYLIGEDVFRPLRAGTQAGLRSLGNPAAFGDPDHYSRRVLGPSDSGGVHTNSSIANHAFYLAIEGGINRTSGLAVQGVGAANREQIEKVFYRAFVFLLPQDATFALARAATIAAARDAYGAGSAAERAVTQAWTAVGVL